MSSRREVFIRILPLLQRKTLIETKNRRLKCLKWHYSTVRSMKVQCWRRTGHLPSFCVPTPGDLTAQESPTPGICHPRQKNAYARGSARRGGGGRRWNWLMHNPFIYHFWQKKYPFRKPSTDKFYHFHLPSLELCFPFNCCQLKYEEYVTKPEHFLPGSSTFS